MNLPNGHYLQNGKYRLTKVIGQGGFGITYLGVWNTEVKGELGAVKTNVPVCIKEYFFKDYCYRDEATFEVKVHSETGKILFDKFKEKQIKEAKILSEVHHPYIVNVLEVFEENNTAYIAMEHIAGSSLKSMLDMQGMLPETKVLKYISQIGQALEFVHQKNILHLDIKPNNILIDQSDNARLIDFGVSKRYDLEQQETSTTTLTLSKGFAAIEQYDNEGTVSFSPCPDIYSLGATMYNLLTGVIPTESILRATKPLVKPSELNKSITHKTEVVILKAMQINPVDRYQSVMAMLNELDIPSYFEDIAESGSSMHEESDAELPVNDESTKVMTGTLYDKPVDEDETIFISPQMEQLMRRKKTKRRFLIPLLIFFFAIVGWAVSYMSNADNSNAVGMNDLVAESLTKQMEPIVPDIQTKPEEPLTDKPDIMENPKTESPAKKEDKKKEELKAKTDKKDSDTKLKAREERAKKEKEAKEAAEAKAKTEKTANANYATLISSGKVKMGQGNYAEAKKDFAKAKDVKVTEEVIRLSLDCDAKIEEKNVVTRKAQYDVSMNFGNYTIVRKKQNGRYGAIDSKGVERIKCVYLSVGKSDNGRAFEREDHLYDIYNSNGVLVGNGLTTY